MPTLRERFANVLLGPEYRDLKAASTAIWSSYERRPYWVSSDQLQELDARTLELIARHYGDISLAGPFTSEAEEEAARKRAVSDSRHLYRADVVTQRITGLWTDFGFGQTIEVKPRDAQLLKDWKEFETAERNRPVLKPRKVQRLSDLLLVDGELFLPFFINKLDGTCTIRRFNPDQITEIICSPEDEDIVLYYKREWTRKGEARPNVLYYKDWQADADELNDVKLPDGAQLADAQRENTDVMLLHVAHHTLGIRGWPLMDAAFPWVRTYKEFLQNRAAVARSVAMIVDKITARTGSRGVEAIRRKLESTLNNTGQTMEQNPAAIAGSTWIENEAATRQRMPLGTGASDAQVDGGALLAMVGLGGGVFAHWLGRGEAFRLATACYCQETEVLTEHGWKLAVDWSYPERIASYCTETGCIEYVTPTALHVYPYQGEMVHFKAKGIDALVTPNHRMLAKNENPGTNKEERRFEINRVDELPCNFSLPSKGFLEFRDNISTFILPGCLSKESNQVARRPYPTRSLDMDAWLGFLGWWLAEGSISFYNKKRKQGNYCNYRVEISQLSTRYREEIQGILDRLPFNFYCREEGWYAYDKRLYDWLLENCGKGAKNKRVPRFVFSLDASQQKLLWDAFWHGDGHDNVDDGHHVKSKGYIGSVSEGLLDDMQHIALHLGYWATVSLWQEAGINGGNINASEMYRMNCVDIEKRSLRREDNIIRLPYSGFVWCFEVPPNGVFITRRNGVPLIAGNTAMEQPVMRQWQRYQSFWADAWRDMVGLVRKGGELYGGKTYSESGVDVSTDALIQVDLRYLAGALSQARTQAFVPVEVAMEKFLQALGVKNVSEILEQAKVEREEKARIDQQATALARAAGAQKARDAGITTPGGDGANAAALARQAKVPAAEYGEDDGDDGE